MSTIDPSLLLSSVSQKQTQTQNTSKTTLGKNDFLKLLIAQLKGQDPMKPMNDTQYISQMANFTSLEQTQNMNNLLQKFIDSQSSQTLANYSNMIGQAITYNTSNSNGSTQTEQSQGIVTSVSLVNGNIVCNTQDGKNVSLSQISSIGQSSV